MVALVRASPATDLMDRIAAERAAALPDAALVRDYRAYLLGKQLDPRTVRQRALFPELEAHAFCDNVCRRVVLTPANRLTLARFDVEGEGATTEAVKAFLDDLGMRNRLNALVTAINAATLRDGDHAVALRWKDSAVRLIREKWWDGYEGVFVRYDDDDRADYAVKEWAEVADGRIIQRRVVQFPDRFERYASEDGQRWMMVNLPEDGVPDGSPVPYTVPDRNGVSQPDGEPLGIPLVHFSNQLVPNDGAGGSDGVRADSRYGQSILGGGVLGIQDRINLVNFDITSTSSFTGTQMLWATGVELPIDPDTKLPIDFAVIPGAFVTSSKDNARFGAFPAGGIATHEAALRILKESVAQATGLPYVMLTGQVPSGEALMRMEADLGEMVDKLGELFGPAYAALAHKATRLGNAYGKAGLDEDLRITAAFAPSQRSNPLAIAQQLGYLIEAEGRREALKDFGKNPDEVERIMADLAEEGAARSELTARAFNAGQLAPVVDGAPGQL